jgi:uncharacterized protein DUF6602
VITNIANLLQELRAKESAKLAQEKITHAPTIGAMYEGLTRELLDRAIPSSLDLRIVDGFIEDHEGNLSPQIDAMLVTGEGRTIPHTGGYVWPIQDVIAVLEVKKNLYGADLDDAFHKLRVVNDMYGRHMRRGGDSTLNIQPAFDAFARLTGRYPRSWEDASALPDPLSFIFHILVCEQLSPVRIIFGYEGYVDELGLRDGFAKFIEGNLTTPRGFGIGSFPNLIVCRNNSLLKMNGQPYISPLLGDWWPAVVSNAENPIRLLIELIWTRLSNKFASYFPMDDTLQMERLAPFLSAKLGYRNGVPGWEYRQETLNRKQLKEIEPTSWEPEHVDEMECVVLIQLAQEGELDVRATKQRDPDQLIAGLVDKRSIAWCDDHTVRLLRSGDLITAFMPDGRTVTAGETDLLGLWFAEQLAKRPNRTPKT